MELTWLATLVPAVLGLLLLIAGIRSFGRRRGVRGTFGTLTGLLFLSLALSMALIAVGMRGYRALTAEQTAATMFVERGDGQAFSVRMEYPDGDAETFELSGDQVYVDARILKWHPLASFIGLQTGYQLERISGRYLEFGDELFQPRTLFELREDEPVDLFSAVRRFPGLAPLVDAEYGSASFLAVRDGGVYQLRVSTTGLLIREVN